MPSSLDSIQKRLHEKITNSPFRIIKLYTRMLSKINKLILHFKFNRNNLIRANLTGTVMVEKFLNNCETIFVKNVHIPTQGLQKECQQRTALAPLHLCHIQLTYLLHCLSHRLNVATNFLYNDAITSCNNHLLVQHYSAKINFPAIMSYKKTHT